MYRCLGSFKVSTTWQGRHIAAAKLVASADGSHLVATSAYGPTAQYARGAMRGPQTFVHELLQKPAQYRRRLQCYPRSRRSPKWAGWSRPRLGAAPASTSPFRSSGDRAGGPALHVYGPHLPIAPRPISLFDQDAGALPIG